MKTNYWFGLPRSVQSGGLIMDVDWSSQMVEAKNADAATRKSFVLSTGALSSLMENGVPEMIYSTPTSQVNGVSAMNLLTLAAQQGMKIYQITQSNVNAVLGLLTVSPDIKSEIANAVAAGKEVTVPQGNLTVGSWVGTGYLILDPDTGAGAYKIGGGLNGGFAEILGNVFEGYFGYKSALMILAGAAETSIFKFYGVLGAVISLELQLIDLWYSCGDKEFAMYMAAIFIVASVMIFAILSFAGLWLGWFLGILLSQTLTYLAGLVKQAPLCTKP
ncbi:MAG: hypothetical protein K0M58_02220 [Thiobacillus sp.]|nr:hypothetical protein [Thiobacillus sp.]